MPELRTLSILAAAVLGLAACGGAPRGESASNGAPPLSTQGVPSAAPSEADLPSDAGAIPPPLQPSDAGRGTPADNPEARPHSALPEPGTETAPGAATDPALAMRPILPEPTAAPPAPVAAAMAGAEEKFAVHLASYLTVQRAQLGWRELSAKVSGLNGSAPMIRAKDMPDGQTIYRLLAGPLPNRATGEDLCRAVRSALDYCEVWTLGDWIGRET